MFDEDNNYKILVIGDSTVGKTSFMRRYVGGSFTVNYKATLGGSDKLMKGS